MKGNLQKGLSDQQKVTETEKSLDMDRQGRGQVPNSKTPTKVSTDRGSFKMK